MTSSAATSSSRVPRSSSDLFPESLGLSPKQRKVLDALHEFPQGAKISEIAEMLDSHVNTVRSHLDELIAKDAVQVMPAPAQGRGRPSFVFHVRAPKTETIAEEYVSLIGVLTSMLVDQENLTPETYAQALNVGRQWAQTMEKKDPKGAAPVGVSTEKDALESLFAKLRDLGFDPSPPAGDLDSAQGSDLDLHACPLTVNGTRPHPFVCAVHEGFLGHLTDADVDPRLRLELHPLSRPGVCSINLSTHRGQASGPTAEE
ncbi:MarR family transcriptional regulator [Corynebacterium stationis]|uniref:MarR family transcriptional regulator n=1 Tax=Corynebacterium stationis TaxID=1705 RepID=UPI000950AD64|nr:MarR family transcriptional regulator [Corynebacterium stationis]APT95269.1 transcriptional regulator [Corynebacterium stationis]